MKYNHWILKRGKYKGWELTYGEGQCFPRAGWCLMKSTKSGKIKDIKYLEDLLT